MKRKPRTAIVTLLAPLLASLLLLSCGSVSAPGETAASDSNAASTGASNAGIGDLSGRLYEGVNILRSAECEACETRPSLLFISATHLVQPSVTAADVLSTQEYSRDGLLITVPETGAVYVLTLDGESLVEVNTGAQYALSSAG